MVLFAAELGGSGSIGGTVIVLVRKQMPFVLYGCEWRLTWWFSRFLLLLGGVYARKKAFRGQFRDPNGRAILWKCMTRPSGWRAL